VTATAHLVQAEAIAARAGALLSGERIVWREALDGGPSSGAPGSGEWLDARAAHLTSRIGVEEEGGEEPYDWAHCRAALAGQEAALDRVASTASELVMWLGNDLVCLLHELYWLARWQELAPAGRLLRVAPPEDEARCLMEKGEALAARFAAREEVAPSEVAASARAFAAFAAPDASHLDEFLADPATGRAGRALALHRERFPALGSGLGRIEEAALAAVGGGATMVELLPAVNAALPGFCVTDVQLWITLRRLADPGCPLVEIAGGPWLRARVSLTALAAEVMAGRRDFAAECQATAWLGGVELGAGLPGWRLDRARGALVVV